MYRIDAAVFAIGTIGLTGADPGASFESWVASAATAGTIIGAGWLLDARIKKTVKGEIEAHTAVEEARMETVKTEFNAEIRSLTTEIQNLTKSLNARPCAAGCGCGRHP